MKQKLLILFLFFLFIEHKSFAQRDLRFGIHGGINVSTITGPDAPEKVIKGKTMNAGLLFEPRLNNYASLWTELNYNSKKFNFTESIPTLKSSSLSVSEKLDYISAPVMLRLRKGDDIILGFVQLGCEFSILANQKREVIAFEGAIQIPTEPYFDYTPIKLDFGFVCGLGFNLKALSFDFRTSIGLKNMYGNEDLREMRFRTYSINIGYELNHPRISKKNNRNDSPIKRIKYKIKHMF